MHTSWHQHKKIVKVVKFQQPCEICSNLWNSVKIVKFKNIERATQNLNIHGKGSWVVKICPNSRCARNITICTITHLPSPFDTLVTGIWLTWTSTTVDVHSLHGIKLLPIRWKSAQLPRKNAACEVNSRETTIWQLEYLASIKSIVDYESRKLRKYVKLCIKPDEWPR